MPSRPLLFFPRQVQVPKNEGSGGRPRLHFPSPTRQRKRLDPLFRELEESFERRSPSLRASPTGSPPEQILVLEIIGELDDFVKALRGIPGLEWMGEFDDEDVDPDEDFYNLKNRRAKLPRRLFLIWHDQAGMKQLLRLKKVYDKNPKTPAFIKERSKCAQLFRQLRTIRPWGPEDRLRETGLLNYWKQAAQRGQQRLRLEVELWPRRGRNQKLAAELVAQFVSQEGGHVLDQYENVEELGYHALLVELPTSAVEHLFDEQSIALVRCEGVMFLRPTGQSAVPIGDQESSEAWAAEERPPLPLAEPVAALLDGLPQQNHPLLTNRLRVEVLDGWEEEYPALDRRHGTAMASLILHGELDAGEPPLSRRLAVLPVLKPHDGWAGREERIPDDLLTVDRIEQAVLKIAKGNNALPAVAAGVRIINLALGDPSRPFDRFPSPWARLLDVLSAKHNLLFIVSAGNHPEPLHLALTPSQYRALSQDPAELRTAVLRSALAETRHRRLLSPAESINAITVGGLNSDRAPEQMSDPDVLDVLGSAELPALYTAHGPGFRRAVKPEILQPGGRWFLRADPGSNGKTVLRKLTQDRVPGQRVASPGKSDGQSTTRFDRGTSNAAALTTRMACQLYDMLVELERQQGESSTGRGYPRREPLTERDFPVLIKALLVHAASWGGSSDLLKATLEKTSRRNSISARLLGFGAVDPARALGCTDQRVTLLGWGMIRPKSAYHFQLPLPASLNGVRATRRLVTTLAWMSPINPYDHRYRRAALALDLYSGERPKGTSPEGALLLGLTRQEVDFKEARRGTVIHEIWKGTKATAYEDAAELNLQISCREDAGKLDGLVRYGLAVTLEVEEATGLKIYDEVTERVWSKTRTRVRALARS